VLLFKLLFIFSSLVEAMSCFNQEFVLQLDANHVTHLHMAPTCNHTKTTVLDNEHNSNVIDTSVFMGANIQLVEVVV